MTWFDEFLLQLHLTIGFCLVAFIATAAPVLIVTWLMSWLEHGREDDDE